MAETLVQHKQLMKKLKQNAETKRIHKQTIKQILIQILVNLKKNVFGTYVKFQMKRK